MPLEVRMNDRDRCQGTQRGVCGYPLHTEVERMRHRCSTCFQEWIGGIQHPVVIYHDVCYDGFGAAWVFYKQFRDTARYIPATYGAAFPENIKHGSDVFIVDFSYPRAVLMKNLLLEHLKKKSIYLVILDHHKSAEEDLRGIPNAIFNMEKSGAMMAWEYLFAPEPPPALINYIMDRDLWKFRLPYSREIGAALRSYRMDFETWNGLEMKIQQLKVDGIAILRQQDQTVEQMCRNAVIRNIGGYDIPVVNCTCYFSEVCETLIEIYPKAICAASYFDRYDKNRQWSLRSKGEFDCTLIARQYGGGGHKNAAGFTTELNWLGENL